ncbi:Ca2+-binding RTX toxin-like protein [Pseudomonas sp. JUb42]|uniref:DUF4214 domain-containing protein n=1 Tax=Pseudomonas sp. JUb42 TaxID=2940611 RepID=UPI002167C3E6|nr:DUF4214 domain-containing protein [Pseudomonas sp. JUb42]MCS3472610.1 Ca2+-binding RTX toxin-like protein [Pseudomonas sp. JUb42]
MSTITYFRPADTFNLNDWRSPSTTALSAYHAQVSDGVHTIDFSGSFIYDATGIIGGTLWGVTFSQGGQTYLAADYLKLDARELFVTRGDSLMALLTSSNDTFIGSDGNDSFHGYTGNDTYNGGSGIDTVFYNASKSDITVTPTGNYYKVATQGMTDTLNGIERIEAGNGSILALDVKAGENTGSAYRIYQAAFDRKPDLTGLNYWVKQMDNGMSLKDVANGFVNSTEFKTMNPGNDTTALLNSYYQHVLHRAPDAVGQAYWSAAMNSGTPAYEVLAAFAESNENIAATAPALNGGIWLS